MSESIDALLSPGLRFLLREVCLPGDRSEPLPAPLSLSQLFEEAKRQKIAGLFSAWAARQDFPLPADIKDALTAIQYQNSIRALALIAASQRASSCIGAAGIDALIVKGPLLSKRFYGDYAIRHAGDVDLLVAPECAADADHALRQRGYTRIKPVKELSPRRLELYLQTQHEFCYRSPESDILIELHWRYSDSRSLSPHEFAGIWQRSERLSVAGQELAVPSAADVFIHLAIHGAVDGWFRLKWIADLPRVLARVAPAELSSVLATTRSAAIARPLALALELAGGVHAHFANLPECSASIQDLLLRHVARRLQSNHDEVRGPPHKIRDTLDGYRYKLHLTQSAASSLELVYANMITPGDFDRISFADSLTPMLPWIAQMHRAWRGLRPDHG